MGRASNRKKAQRQSTQPDLRRIKQHPRSPASAPPTTLNIDAIVQQAKRRRSIALSAWLGDAEPEPATVPSWPQGSLGHRLLAETALVEMRAAPSLLTAPIPDAAAIAAEPLHWVTATEALIRAVVLDGLTLEHPATSALLQALVPVVEAEVAYLQAMNYRAQYIAMFDEDDGSDFPEVDVPFFPDPCGPLFLLGDVLTEAVGAVEGDDSLADVSGVLELVLDGVVPGLDAQRLVEALVAARYAMDEGDSDNPLALLALDDVPPRDILPAGLLMLSALARLCQSSSRSVLGELTTP